MLRVAIEGTLEIDATDSTHADGGVAFGGDQRKFDDLKIGYDNNSDDDIREALANGEASYDLDREEGLFRQWAGIYRSKMRWMAIFATIESVVFLVLIVLAAVEFFQADDTKWQIFYATGILLPAWVVDYCGNEVLKCTHDSFW